MIQRIQSVYLLLASLALGLLNWLPFGNGNEIENSILSDSLFNIHDHTLLQGASIAGTLIFLVAIFLFKNRNVQSIVAMIGLFLTGVVIGIVASLYFKEQNILSDTGQFAFSFGAALPIVSVVLGLLGIRNIKKDNKIVKSMDRLR